ncbi:putative Myb/SANT-like domain-containing protein [Helianthus annuus]|nr:putative Myb/SANT-like domain-containing protein [Helianthus annuus]
MEKLRGRGKNKCYWKEDETQLLIEVLQDMASDPSWKANGGFRSNYMVEVHRRIITKMPHFSKQVSPHIESKVKWLKSKFHVINDMVKQNGCRWNEVEEKIACEKQWYKSYCQSHKEAKGLWEFKFPFFNQLELVYGRDRPNGTVVEANDDVIPKLEVAVVEANDDVIPKLEVTVVEANGKLVNSESEDENHDESDDSLSEEEEDDDANNDNKTSSQATPTPARKMAIKRKTMSNIEDGIMKKTKTKTTSSHDDIVARLDELDSSFRAFVEGFNASFATMANLVTSIVTDDNLRQKTASEKLKNAINEIMKFNLSSDDVFKAAEIFAANKNKIDVFFSLPEQLRVSYVIRNFNSKFVNMENAKIDDDISQKRALEKLKDVLIEITKLNLSSDDVFKAADIFATEKNKIDVFFNLPEQLRVQYVMRLTGQSSSS